MKSKLKVGVILVAMTFMAVLAPNRFTVRAERADDGLTYSARLSGFGEVPPKLADGSGKFTGTLADDGMSISWTISWNGLTGPAQAAHIHFGQAQVNGNVVVFFCGGGGRPACPDGTNHSGMVSGTWTAADILAVPAQNVSVGDFTGFLKFLNAKEGYANIHTPLFPGGEIRGQVSVHGEND